MNRKELLEKALEISQEAEKLTELLNRYLKSEDGELYYRVRELSRKISTDLETWRYQFRKTFERSS